MYKNANVEIFHQGFLVKSPPKGNLPTQGIFRARWRRRWFTLKQGELPGQFVLEYFIDKDCKKRKGIIDLDKVEQVDAGLRLDRQSIKFQHMFDMKTPNRTYYLAADSEQEMRNWVMVICQVCNLQETEEKNVADPLTVQYCNIGPNSDFEAREVSQTEQSTTADTKLLRNISSDSASIIKQFDQLSIVNDYENDNIVTYRQPEEPHRSAEYQNNDIGMNYTNLPPMGTLEKSTARLSNPIAKSTGAIKKIPENLKLRSDDKINNNSADDHLMYRASGPYIPLSDCFSGSPVLFKNDNVPKTPLNSLDPKFYETPRSHITNIGLNLTNDQPNSPKRNNTSNAPSQVSLKSPLKSGDDIARNTNSTPTDSEGGSTDEEWTDPKHGNRRTRPSECSIENDSVAITAGQSFMKMGSNAFPLPPKSANLIEKRQESSDTEENASPMIGPKDSSSCVDERYDFPRSYNVQGFSGSQMNFGMMGSMASIEGQGHLMTSTPNLIHNDFSTLERSKMNFYSNAAPRENNIFRFDFANSSSSPPKVNRTLKPRKDSNGYGIIKSVQPAPSVDRKLKPSAKPQSASTTNSLKRRGPESLSLPEVDDSAFLNDSLASNHSTVLTPDTPNKGEDRLQYLDLDHTGQGDVFNISASIASGIQNLDGSISGSNKDGPGVAYTTVDFLKTDAFNRVREDSEMTRASKSRIGKT